MAKCKALTGSAVKGVIKRCHYHHHYYCGKLIFLHSREHAAVADFSVV